MAITAMAITAMEITTVTAITATAITAVMAIMATTTLDFPTKSCDVEFFISFVSLFVFSV
jgi:hypothetical protein